MHLIDENVRDLRVATGCGSLRIEKDSRCWQKKLRSRIRTIRRAVASSGMSYFPATGNNAVRVARNEGRLIAASVSSPCFY